MGLTDRVELRLQSLSDLSDEEAFDLAWCPQPFIARAVFEAGLPRIHRATRPNRWLVVSLATGGASDPFEIAVFAHSADILGGGPIGVDEAKALLTAAGFDQFTATRWAGQVLALAHRP